MSGRPSIFAMTFRSALFTAMPEARSVTAPQSPPGAALMSNSVFDPASIVDRPSNASGSTAVSPLMTASLKNAPAPLIFCCICSVTSPDWAGPRPSRIRSTWKEPPSGFSSVNTCSVVTSEGTYSVLMARNAAPAWETRRR